MSKKNENPKPQIVECSDVIKSGCRICGRPAKHTTYAFPELKDGVNYFATLCCKHFAILFPGKVSCHAAASGEALKV